MGLEAVEIVMAVEEEFAIEIPDSEAAKLETVGSLHLFVLRTLQAQEGTAHVDEATVWARLRDIVVNQLGVPPESVTPAAYFVRDLGVD